MYTIQLAEKWSGIKKELKLKYGEIKERDTTKYPEEDYEHIFLGK